MELVEALQPLEQDDLTHFSGLHIDVLNEDERWQKKERKSAGKKRRQKRGGAESEAYDVAYALVRAASRFFSMLGFEFISQTNWCRDESRHGTHECVRHGASAYFRT